MARKIECDRCQRQWVDSPNQRYSDDEEMATIRLDIPSAASLPPHKSATRKWEERPRVCDTYDLCQDCARVILSIIQKGPEPSGPIQGQVES